MQRTILWGTNHRYTLRPSDSCYLFGVKSSTGVDQLSSLLLPDPSLINRTSIINRLHHPIVSLLLQNNNEQPNFVGACAAGRFILYRYQYLSHSVGLILQKHSDSLVVPIPQGRLIQYLIFSSVTISTSP